MLPATRGHVIDRSKTIDASDYSLVLSVDLYEVIRIALFSQVLAETLLAVAGMK